MVSAKELFKEKPKFFTTGTIAREICKEVYERAVPHTQRGNLDEFYRIERPYEPDAIRTYREAIRRNITIDVPNEWLSKTTRILQFSGHGKDNRTFSDLTQSHLQTNPFFINGERHNFHHWMFRKVLPKAIEDANARIVVIPYNPEDFTAPPSLSVGEGGLSSNNRVYPIPHLVRYDQIVYDHDGVFAFQHGSTELIVNKTKKNEPNYFVIDMEAYWRLVPFVNEKKKVEYKLEPWYVHSRGLSRLDRLPVVGVPGRFKAYMQKGVEIEYKESYLAGAFESGHEVLISFSNDQGLRAVHGNPKLQVPSDVCRTCGGDGTVKSKHPDEHGNYLDEKCGECKGTMRSQNPGAYEVYVAPEGNGIDGKGVDAFKYAAAPEGPLKHSWEVWRTLKADMKRQAGLDLMDQVAGESGEAKKMRENKLKDQLKEIHEDIHYLEETVAWIIEQLLVIDVNRRVRPVVPMVVDFELRSLEELREMAKDTNCVDYRERNMKYLNYAYRGNDVKIRAHSLAFEYAPIITHDSNIWLDLIAEGRFDANDVVRREYAVIAFEEILSNPANMSKDNAELIAMAEQWIESRGLFKNIEELPDMPSVFIEEINE